MDEIIGIGYLSLLTNDTRLGIVEALAAQRRESPAAPEMSFSALAEEVGVSDTGRFNYHLDKLRGSFIERTDDGYGLTMTGHTIVAAVLGASVERQPQYEETLRDECPVCGTTVTAERDSDMFFVTCESGHGFGEMLPPRFGAHVDTATTAEQAAIRAVGNFREAQHGLCPKCSGQVEWSFAHEEHGEIDSYDAGVPVLGICRTCGTLYTGSPEGFVFFEPPVVARLEERGFDVWADPVEWWIRGEGGTVESVDESGGTVDARFDFPEFSMTATVTKRCELVEFAIDDGTTATR